MRSTLPVPDWGQRTDAALNWLRRSIAATGGLGSAHSYSLLWGWARAYPETTGYLIPTLLRYASIKREDSLRQLAIDCGDWLCSIQLNNGAFAGGLAGETAPSVFNTSQILFGFAKLDEEILAEENNVTLFSKKQRWRKAMARAIDWLTGILEPDGAWRQAAYRPGVVPSYYTRAVWGVLEAGKRLNMPESPDFMRKALRYYANRFQPGGTIRDWGFRPEVPAFTHTIAYTLEGFLESALLFGEEEILTNTVCSADTLLALRTRAGKTAGRYGANWQADYSFRCLSGNTQLSILYFRLWEFTRKEIYREASLEFLMEILPYQELGTNKHTHGALPGSAPVWGPYLRFRYPNWGVKFFLDAMANWGL